MFIIGNDEYNYYKSTDNGKTWNFFKEGSGDAFTHNGRIIIYGKDNDGLKYTDDNFTTINNSNIINGNWIALKNEEINDLYTTSLDGKGIYKSIDNGETWERVSLGTGDQIEKDGDKIIIFGKGDVIELPSGTYTPNATYKDKTIVQMLVEGISTDDCLIYILNEIILPGLCSMLTGYKHLKDLNGLYNNEAVYQSFYTNKELYKTDSSKIDFAVDVGMMPLDENDIKEYTEYKKELEDIIIAYDDNNNEIKLLKLLDNKESKISKTFDILDSLLTAYKNYILKASFENIKNKEEDYNGFNTAEDKDSMRSFYEIRKGSEMSIVGTIINSAFTFSYSKKMALLKTSIIETARKMKSSINLCINIAKDYISQTKLEGDMEVPKYSKEEILNNKELNNLFKYDLLNEWKDAIKRCIEDYYRIISNNINHTSEYDDKEFISEAAFNYHFTRLEMIDTVKDIIENSNPDNYDIMNTLDEKRNTLLKSLEKDILQKIKELDASVITKDEFNKELNNLLINFKESEEELHSDERIYYNSIYNNYFNIFSKSLLNKTSITLVGRSPFDKETYEEYWSMYGVQNTDKIFDYYEKIVIEFKSRCQKLLNIISKNVIESFPEEMDDYYNVRKYILDLQSTKDKNNYSNISFKSLYHKDSGEKFIKVIKQSWKNMRNKI